MLNYWEICPSAAHYGLWSVIRVPSRSLNAGLQVSYVELLWFVTPWLTHRHTHTHTQLLIGYTISSASCAKNKHRLNSLNCLTTGGCMCETLHAVEKTPDKITDIKSAQCQKPELRHIIWKTTYTSQNIQSVNCNAPCWARDGLSCPIWISTSHRKIVQFSHIPDYRKYMTC